MVKPQLLFSTPIWHVRGDVPSGALEWALEYEKEHPHEYGAKSNRGGYQSLSLSNTEDFPYIEEMGNRLKNCMPKCRITNWWLNVNRKGDYNVKHNHPTSNFAIIWYFTDNNNSLKLEDPLSMSRQVFHDTFNTRALWDYEVVYSWDCTAGEILVFPSDVPHWVESHELDTPRVSVSFNAIV